MKAQIKYHYRTILDCYRYLTLLLEFPSIPELVIWIAVPEELMEFYKVTMFAFRDEFYNVGSTTPGRIILHSETSSFGMVHAM